MVFLVCAEETAPAGLFGRLRRALNGDEGYRIESTVVLGMRMRRLTIQIPADAGRNELIKVFARAAGQMRRERADRLIFSNTFRNKELLLCAGFEEMDAGPLMSIFAGRIAAAVAGSGTAAVLFARQMTGRAVTTLRELAGSFRCVMAVTESGGGAIFESLRRQTGVSVLEQPSAGQMRLSGAAVFFDAPQKGLCLPDGCTAVEAGKGALEGVVCRRAVTGIALRPAPGRAEEMPPGFPEEHLIAAALAAGTLRPEDVKILDITVSAGGAG